MIPSVHARNHHSIHLYRYIRIAGIDQIEKASSVFTEIKAIYRPSFPPTPMVSSRSLPININSVKSLAVKAVHCVENLNQSWAIRQFPSPNFWLPNSLVRKNFSNKSHKSTYLVGVYVSVPLGE